MERLCMGCMEMYDDTFDVCPHCGYAFDTPPLQSYHLTPGAILQQRYIVGKVLGYGGFGVTYIGWDYLMERKIAIKEYLPGEFATRMATQTQVTVYPGEKEEQFKEGLVKTVDEAKRLAKFEQVPGIVQIYDCFEENGTSYIVMELLTGMSLKQYISEKGNMSVDQALNVVLQVASAMEAVHRENILHRDIAPDNIYVLNPDEPDALQVKLLDFGAARYATTKHSKSLSVIIKPGYAPEEQYRSRGDQGTWTDVYALAATLYKMLTGVTPEDAMERSVKDEVKRPSKMGIKITKPMETALMNALNIKIQDRTQTMQDFAAELIAAEVQERKATKTKSDVGKVPVWVMIIAGIALAGVLAVGVMIATGVIKTGLRRDRSEIESSMVMVPNVVNENETDAEKILTGADLNMNKDHMAYSNEIPENMISYQSIEDNTVVEKYTEVKVWISLGKEKAQIPALMGLQREDAEEALMERGFRNITIVESDEEGAFNTIIGISVEEGGLVVLDDEITLKVCIREAEETGDTVIIPDIMFITRDEAEDAMAEAGLLINWVGEYSDTEEKDTILRIESTDGKTLKAGDEAQAGEYIVVVYSLGAETIYMQNVVLESESSARAIIEGLGLKVGRVTTEYSETVASGKVIRASKNNGDEVKKGESIDLVISKGPDPAKQKPTAPQAQAQPQTQAPPQTQAAPPQTQAAPPQTQAAPPQTQAAPPQTQAAPQPTSSGGIEAPPGDLI